MLDLALVGVSHADAGHRFGMRTGLPHAAYRFPVALVVLHLSPDKVVAGVGHGAVGFWCIGAVDGAAGNRFALHHLDHDGIPDLGVGRTEGGAVLPLSRIDWSLVDGAKGRRFHLAGVLAGGYGE